MADLSPYQQKIVRRYYENRGDSALQRLQELATELYLAQGKARARHWANARKSLEALKVPESRIAHLVESDNPALLVKIAEELMAKLG